MDAVVMVTKKLTEKKNVSVPREAKTIKFEKLLQYSEITIVGGEPMVISERVVEMVHRLRLQGYTGAIYLDTQDARRLEKYWAVKMLIDEVDGIFYEVRVRRSREETEKVLKTLRRLSNYLEKTDRSDKFDTLILDQRLNDDAFIKSLKGWSRIYCNNFGLHSVKRAYRIENPSGAELVYYDLEAEG